MKQYIGCKELEAKPMTREDAEKHLGRDVGGDRTGEGYLVEYEGGYQAWSPKDVFEKAYQELHPDGYEFDVNPENIELPSHVYRMTIEFGDLFKKTEALATFVMGEKYKTLSEKEQNRMAKQLRCMVMYRDVLYNRIKAS